MQYELRVFDGKGVRSFTVEATDTVDALEQARRSSWTVLSIRQGVVTLKVNANFPLLLFAQELHALMCAGLELVEALEVLAERASDKVAQTAIGRLLVAIKNGESFSSALAGQSNIFPVLFVGIVHSAEGTSALPDALKRYIDYEVRLGGLRQKIINAAIYPAILMAVGLLVSLFLLGYVVPKFALVYRESGRALPWASQMLMDWGIFASRHSATLVTGFVVMIVAIAWIGRIQLRSKGVLGALAWFPGVGQRLHIFELSRFYLTLGMLIEGGIPILQALSLAKEVLTSSHQTSLTHLQAKISGGEKLSNAMAMAGLDTPVATRFLKVGEQTGNIGKMLTRTAEFYDQETGRWIEQFTKVFEPMLMVAIGLMVGLVVMLLYIPIFDLAGSLQ